MVSYMKNAIDFTADFFVDYLVREISEQVKKNGRKLIHVEDKQHCDWTDADESAVLYQTDIYTFDDKRYRIIITDNNQKEGWGTKKNFVGNGGERTITSILIWDYYRRGDNEPLRKVMDAEVMDSVRHSDGMISLGRKESDYKSNEKLVSELSDICNRINPEMVFSFAKETI